MTPTREEVERLAKRFDVNAADWRWDEDHHAARDMLRALADERDAALAEAARLREAHAELDAWARSEIARLRRLWNYMHEAASDIEADEPMTAAEWLAEFTAAEQITRAALTVEARDE